MVEFPQDMWDKIKSFRTISSFNPNDRSLIIKDVVLKIISTKADHFNQLHNWFIIEDDIIHSKSFLEVGKYTNVLIKKRCFN